MNEGHESVDVPLLIDVSNDSRKVFKKESGCQSNSTLSTVDQQTSRLQARFITTLSIQEWEECPFVINLWNVHL